MPSMKGDSMRGLAAFISDIRNCKGKEAEMRRINRELANIRSKFKGDKTMDGYQKKKYVCKLLYIFLLGHEIDFGYTEAVNLLCSNRYTEKHIGYLFISVLVSEQNNVMNLVIQRLKDDLSSNNPVFVNLALHCIANIGSREMVEEFSSEVSTILVNGDTSDNVRQSAALCLLKLIRTAPELVNYEEWPSRAIHLLSDQHMGVATAASSLVEALVKRNADDNKACISLAVSRLSRIVSSPYTDLQDYTYYFVPAPWLSVKLLKLLQHFAPMDESLSAQRIRINECLESILYKAAEPPKSQKFQHSNARNAVLFEAINLIIQMDCNQPLLIRSCVQLGTFLTHRDTNLRYLALESMCLLATSEYSHEVVKRHTETVINALKNERDVSVRQRAVDLLYAMCDRSNSENIVSEMLSYLERADYSIREEMVLKVAILAEKYAVDYKWYVDTILNLIRIAGDYVSEEVWYRVIQIVINHENVQGYAAKTVFEALQAAACHENMVKVGGYILGEFGNLIAGDSRSSPQILFALLHSKFHLCSIPTRQLLLSTYMKFINLFPEIKPIIHEVLQGDMNLRNADIEIQQRAIEYLTMSNVASTEVIATVLEEMPPFPERESNVLSKLKMKRPYMTNDNGRPSSKNRTSVTAPVADGEVEENENMSERKPSDKAHESADNKDLIGLSDAERSEAPAIGQVPISLLDLLDDVDVTSTTTTTTVKSEVTKEENGFGGMDSAMFINNDMNDSGFGDISPTPDNYNSVICRPRGVLFENDLIQIGFKSEFQKQLGRIGMYYGNKSTVIGITDFSAELSLIATDADSLRIESKPTPSSIDAGAQMSQMFNFTCVKEFDFAVRLIVRFMYSGARQSLNLRLPMNIFKFMRPVDMDKQMYLQRWYSLSSPNQESQKIFSANQDMSLEFIKSKLSGIGLSHLTDVDPSPNNYVGAGIIFTAEQQIGVLLRLEPNTKNKMYRATVRSFRSLPATLLISLLEEQL